MTRRGTTLVELVVALVLGSVVAGLFAQSLTVQRRAERAVARSTGAASAADEAVAVLSATIARISDADSLLVRGDTALEWRATIGVALACFAASDSLVVPDTGLAAWWESPPDSGDVADMVNADGSWTSSEILVVSTRLSGGACGGAQRTLRLRSARSGGGVPLVRVARRRRFMLYRGGDGAWWLGERTCSNGAPVHCDAAQPVAGPLSPPPAGVRFALDSSGTHRAVAVTVTAGALTRKLMATLRP